MGAPRELPNLDLAPVERMQAELLADVEALMVEPDLERQTGLVRRIADRTEDLQRLCAALEARARSVATEARGQFEVVLTADQRRDVLDGTGEALESVWISDGSGAVMQAMPMMPPGVILGLAMEEGRRRRERARARRAARDELARIREELASAPEQVRMEIERMLSDPTFAAAFAD